MNKILKIIETRDLYIHLILFKIYLETRGKTDTPFGGDMRRDLKELFGKEYSHDKYRVAEQYLESEGFTKYNASCYTECGRRYFEDWIRDFENLNQEEHNILQKELSPKMYEFFGLAEKAKTVLDVISKLIEIAHKV